MRNNRTRIKMSETQRCDARRVTKWRKAALRSGDSRTVCEGGDETMKKRTKNEVSSKMMGGVVGQSVDVEQRGASESGAVLLVAVQVETVVLRCEHHGAVLHESDVEALCVLHLRLKRADDRTLLKARE